MAKTIMTPAVRGQGRGRCVFGTPVDLEATLECDAGIAAVMDAVYVSLILEQGEDDWGIVVVFASLIGSSAVADALGSVLVYGPARTGLLSGGAATLIVVGILGIFSIGLPLVVARWLAVGAAIRSGAEAARYLVIVAEVPLDDQCRT